MKRAVGYLTGGLTGRLRGKAGYMVDKGNLCRDELAQVFAGFCGAGTACCEECFAVGVDKVDGVV